MSQTSKVIKSPARCISRTTSKANCHETEQKTRCASSSVDGFGRKGCLTFIQLRFVPVRARFIMRRATQPITPCNKPKDGIHTQTFRALEPYYFLRACSRLIDTMPPRTARPLLTSRITHPGSSLRYHRHSSSYYRYFCSTYTNKMCTQEQYQSITTYTPIQEYLATYTPHQATSNY